MDGEWSDRRRDVRATTGQLHYQVHAVLTGGRIAMLHCIVGCGVAVAEVPGKAVRIGRRSCEGDAMRGTSIHGCAADGDGLIRWHCYRHLQGQGLASGKITDHHRIYRGFRRRYHGAFGTMHSSRFPLIRATAGTKGLQRSPCHQGRWWYLPTVACNGGSVMVVPPVMLHPSASVTV